MKKESHNIEWKESWRDEHLKALCGFANAEGGRLVVGKDDRGNMVGVSNPRRLIEDLPNKQGGEDGSGSTTKKTTPITTPETPVETLVETLVKTRAKTPERILEQFRNNPQLALADVAKLIGKSTSTVERACSKLLQQGRLQHVGPRKGGHWEVLAPHCQGTAIKNKKTIYFLLSDHPLPLGEGWG